MTIGRIACLAAIAASAILAGCGGDDDETSAVSSTADGGAASTAPGSAAEQTGNDAKDKAGSRGAARARFIQEAETICNRGKAMMVGEFQRYERENESGSPTDPGYPAVEEILIPGIEQQLKQLRELEIPDGDSGQVESYLSAMDAGLEAIESKELSSNDEIQGALRPAGDIALAYGMRACGYGY